MTRYRTVHCLIWSDDKFPFVSDDCQLVWFHILTTPFSSPFGLYKATPEMLAAEKRWALKRYLKAFQEGLAECFFKYHPKHQLILIPKFLKYNPPHNPNVLKAWSKVYDELPDCSLKAEFYHTLKVFLESYGEGFQEVFLESFEVGSLNDHDTDTGSVPDLSSKPKPKSFIKPTLEEIKEFCSERGNSIDPEKFMDFYISNGWKVGKNPMKDWKATLRGWEKSDKQNGKSRFPHLAPGAD